MSTPPSSDPSLQGIVTCDAGHIDDAALGFTDKGEEGLSGADHPHQVDVQTPPPYHIGRHLYAGRVEDACVIH